MTLPFDFSVLKNFRTKHIPENRTQNRVWNKYLDFTAKEGWRLNSPEMNLWITTSGKIFEVKPGQSQVSSKTEDIAELTEMLQMTAWLRGTIDRAVKNL